jgi:hypothetical protein
MTSSPWVLPSGITWHPAWTTWGGSPVLLTETFWWKKRFALMMAWSIGHTLWFTYILIYVNDILCVHHEPGTSLTQIHKYVKMKPGSIMEPTFYLGAKLKNNAKWCCGLGHDHYQVRPSSGSECAGVHEEEWGKEVEEEGIWSLWGDVQGWNLWDPGVGCVELGRIDIITEVSTLSTFVCVPREGHLDDVYHLFAYLSLHHNARVVFDPTYPDIYMCAFIKTDWKPMYGDVKEAIPPNAHVTRWKAIDLRLFVDSDHAGEHFTLPWGQALLYIWIWRPLCGSPRDSLLLGQLCLGLSLLQWRMG